MAKALLDPTTMLTLSKRRAEFDRRASTATNSTLREKYEGAAALTVRAARLVEHFPDAVQVYQEQGAAAAQALDAQLAAAAPLAQQAQQLAARIKAETDPREKERLELQAAHFAQKLGGKEALLVAWQLSQPKSTEALVRPVTSTLDLVVRPDRREVLAELLRTGGELALHGLGPIGLILAGGLSVGRLATREEQEQATTDGALNYVDDYSAALGKWCEAAEALIERLERTV
jgi:hypothetical protein